MKSLANSENAGAVVAATRENPSGLHSHAENASENISDLEVIVHQAIPEHWPSGADEGVAAFHIFQSKEFLRSWEESFGADDRYTAVYVDVRNEDGSSLMLVPLCVDDYGGTRKLTFIDQGHADYNNPVLFPPMVPWRKEIFEAVWKRVVDNLPPFDVAVFDKMPERVFAEFNPFTFLFQEKNEEFCHGINLKNPLAEVEATQVGVKHLRRKNRKLERVDKVELHVVTNAANSKRFIERLLVQKQRRYEETMVPGFEKNPHPLEFLRAATDHLSMSGNFRLFALQVGEEIVAVSWGLTRGHHVYSLVTGFEDGVWRKYSCGKILVLRTLQWLKENEFEYFDHGYGDEGYKVESCDVTVELYRAEFASNLKGWLYLRRTSILKQLRSTYLWRTLRPLKWKLISRS